MIMLRMVVTLNNSKPKKSQVISKPADRTTKNSIMAMKELDPLKNMIYNEYRIDKTKVVNN